MKLKYPHTEKSVDAPLFNLVVECNNIRNGLSLARKELGITLYGDGHVVRSAAPFQGRAWADFRSGDHVDLIIRKPKRGEPCRLTSRVLK